jgi:FKBP-type peptidyl-prolyl cis-trans isomerase SlyD
VQGNLGDEIGGRKRDGSLERQEQGSNNQRETRPRTSRLKSILVTWDLLPATFTMPRVVTFHYTLRDPSGRVLDSSAGGAPVTYLEGAGQIIDGLDEQLRAAGAGAKQRVQVPAAKAYGVHDAAQVQRVKRAVLPVEGELRIGDQFQTDTDRFAPVVTVAAIEGDEVLLDANHPLAGVDLTFDVEVVDVRDATAEELRHGHAHGVDGQATCS